MTHTTMMTVLGVLAALTAIIGPWVGGLFWIATLKGDIRTANGKIAGNKDLHDQAIDALNQRLSDAIGALAKFDENTQEEVKGYRLHTDAKIDALGRDISAKLDTLNATNSAKFERVFDKLDEKADKA